MFRLVQKDDWGRVQKDDWGRVQKDEWGRVQKDEWGHMQKEGCISDSKLMNFLYFFHENTRNDGLLLQKMMNLLYFLS